MADLPIQKRLKPHNMPSLPLTNENDIQAMEKWLLCDVENNIALCDYLTSFGSTNNEKKAATTIMQKVIYNLVIKYCNFDCHGEKTGFKTLNLQAVIEGALSFKFPYSDLDIGLKTIKSWLQTASSRKQEESNGSNNH